MCFGSRFSVALLRNLTEKPEHANVPIVWKQGQEILAHQSSLYCLHAHKAACLVISAASQLDCYGLADPCRWLSQRDVTLSQQTTYTHTIGNHIIPKKASRSVSLVHFSTRYIAPNFFPGFSAGNHDSNSFKLAVELSVFLNPYNKRDLGCSIEINAGSHLEEALWVCG